MTNLIITIALTPVYIIVLIGTALAVAATITIGLIWLALTAPATIHNQLKQRQDDRRKMLDNGEQND